MRTVYHASGIQPRLLSGTDEAAITLAGVRSALQGLPPSIVVLDIGGGSTELVAMNATSIAKAVSIPLGVISLTEKF